MSWLEKLEKEWERKREKRRQKKLMVPADVHFLEINGEVFLKPSRRAFPFRDPRDLRGRGKKQRRAYLDGRSGKEYKEESILSSMKRQYRSRDKVIAAILAASDSSASSGTKKKWRKVLDRL